VVVDVGSGEEEGEEEEGEEEEEEGVSGWVNKCREWCR
jgi:hypothetical protein